MKKKIQKSRDKIQETKLKAPITIFNSDSEPGFLYHYLLTIKPALKSAVSILLV